MSITTPDARPPMSITGSLPPKRGWPLIAWVVITIAVVYSAGSEAIRARLDPRFAARWKEYNERNYLSDLQISGREIVGMVRFFDQTPKSAAPQIEEGLTHGPYEQRLRYVILSGEIDGPDAALEHLATMRRRDWPEHSPTEEQVRLTELVEKVYQQQQHRLLTEEQVRLTELVEKVFCQQQRRLVVGSLGGSAATVAIKRAAAESEEQVRLTVVVEKVFRQQQRSLVVGSVVGGTATVAIERAAAEPAEQVRLTELVEKVYRQQQRRLVVGSVGGCAATVAIKRAAAEPVENASDGLTDSDRAELRDKLDWFGELALAPEGGDNPNGRAIVLASAQRVIVVFFVIVVTFLMMASLGLVMLLTAVFLLAMRVLYFRFLTGSRDEGIYAETFALWMMVYLVLERASSFVPLGSFRMLAAGIVGLLTLGTLFWPVLRGVHWQRVRQDVGWWTPGPAGLEMLWGLGGYLASFPLLILGVMASVGLLSLYNHVVGTDPFGIPPQATHPVKELLARGNGWEILQILFVASVCAPIIEETMFRGVLYRHLREVGSRWPRAVRVLFSVVSSSFIFAVIHPQGFLGVPVLMALATGFALTRELRGSLVGCMTAHGINNALVTLVAVSMS
jgi:membrane protease YdiL (CAAX protease family)